MDELLGYDAIGLSELIRKGDITPSELLETTIQRIEKVNPKLNAIIVKLYDQARTAAANLTAGDKGVNQIGIKMGSALLSNVSYRVIHAPCLFVGPH